jgi:hypothetical protein
MQDLHEQPAATPYRSTNRPDPTARKDVHTAYAESCHRVWHLPVRRAWYHGSCHGRFPTSSLRRCLGFARQPLVRRFFRIPQYYRRDLRGARRTVHKLPSQHPLWDLVILVVLYMRSTRTGQLGPRTTCCVRKYRVSIQRLVHRARRSLGPRGG